MAGRVKRAGQLGLRGAGPHEHRQAAATQQCSAAKAALLTWAVYGVVVAALDLANLLHQAGVEVQTHACSRRKLAGKVIQCTRLCLLHLCMLPHSMRSMQHLHPRSRQCNFNMHAPQQLARPHLVSPMKVVWIPSRALALSRAISPSPVKSPALGSASAQGSEATGGGEYQVRLLCTGGMRQQCSRNHLDACGHAQSS